MRVEHIFIIHYNKAIDRRAYLDENLPKFNIPYTFRCLYDRQSPEIFDTKYFDISKYNKDKRNNVFEKYGMHIPEGLILETDPITSYRNKAYRACTLEHYKTFEYIYLNTNYEHVLILEDDVCFNDDFLNKLNFFEQNIPTDYDICYIGSGCNLQLPYETEKLFGKHPLRQSKCSDSYIINRNTLKKIVETILPFYSAIDWDLNYIQQLHEMNVYWSTNPLTFQGSQHGKYTSCFSITTNHLL